MLSRIYMRAAGIVMLAASLLGALSGCGGSAPMSEEDFLESVRGSNVTGEEGAGTIPPVGESMDQVARIRVETNEMDVGTIANDRLHHTKLMVYNDGKYPLKLTRVDTTCACTQGFIDPQRAEVPPGGESWIDVVIDPYRIAGFHSRKVLSITSTDPTQGLVEVGVTAQVAPEYEISAETVELGDIQKGESVETRIRWRQLQEQPINLGAVDPVTAGANGPTIPGVAARLEAIPEAEWKQPARPEYDIVVTVGPELTAGSFERRIQLNHDLPRFKFHRIILTGTVVAPYEVKPAYPTRAQLISDPATGALSTVITVTAESPVTLLGISAEEPALAVEARPGASANEAALAVTLSGEAAAKPMDTVIRFQVQVGDQVFDEFVAVRAGTPAAAAAADAGLPQGHSEGDGHNH